VRQQLMQKAAPELQPLRFQQLPPLPHISRSATLPAEWSPKVRTLILYDHTSKWGWVGGLDATMTANLVGHFGPWDAKPASEYRHGEV